jgi:hypothetical protein
MSFEVKVSSGDRFRRQQEIYLSYRRGRTEMSRQAHVDGLVAYLRDLVGDSVRSCVEYTLESSTNHYLREDIPVDAG